MNSIFHRHRGSSIVEVLVAVVIFSVGTLAFMALQTVSLTGVVDANQRTTASWVAMGLIDKIASKPGAISEYVAASTDCSTNPPAACSAGVDGTTISCTAQQMAQYDVWEAACQLDDDLINESMAITCVDADTTDALACSRGSAVTLAITWASKTIADSKRIDGASADAEIARQNFTVEFYP